MAPRCCRVVQTVARCAAESWSGSEVRGGAIFSRRPRHFQSQKESPVLLQNLGTGTKTWMRDCDPSAVGSRRLADLARKAEVAGVPATVSAANGQPIAIEFDSCRNGAMVVAAKEIGAAQSLGVFRR